MTTELYYTPRDDYFSLNTGEKISIERAKEIVSQQPEDKILPMNMAMGRVLQFNWDMKRVHDYYGN